MPVASASGAPRSGRPQSKAHEVAFRIVCNVAEAAGGAYIEAEEAMEAGWHVPASAAAWAAFLHALFRTALFETIIQII